MSPNIEIIIVLAIIIFLIIAIIFFAITAITIFAIIEIIFFPCRDREGAGGAVRGGGEGGAGGEDE